MASGALSNPDEQMFQEMLIINESSSNSEDETVPVCTGVTPLPTPKGGATAITHSPEKRRKGKTTLTSEQAKLMHEEMTKIRGFLEN